MVDVNRTKVDLKDRLIIQDNRNECKTNNMEKNIEKLMLIKVRPYLHQVNAFEFCLNNYGLLDGQQKSAGTALLMEMGTGKTLVSIAVAGYLYKWGEISRVLVVAPKSVLGVWQEEFAAVADFPYTLTVLRGTVEQKKQQLCKLPCQGLSVVVVNYESTWRMTDELLSYNADLAVADEGHKIKDSRTKQSKAMHHLGDKARYKMLLSGTPITNSELDVFSQYRFLDPEVYGSTFYSFRKKFFYMGGYRDFTPIFREKMRSDFMKQLHSIAFRVTKSESLDLPVQTEEIITVELEEDVAQLYETVERNSYAEMADSEVTASNILTKILRLSQITGGFLSDDSGLINSVSHAKLNALSDIVDSVMAERKKLVIMAHFRPELDAIQKLLEGKKIGYAVVRGGTKGCDSEIYRFQRDERCRVFLGQIASAGVGITLTAASTMVFFSLDYSYANYRQARDRIHRLGQKEVCHYIYLACRGTIDNKVLRALQEKRDLAKMIIDDYRAGKNPFSA